MDARYRVIISSTGRDCDGPIDHGTDVFTWSHNELALQIGLLTLRLGTPHVEEHPGSLFMVFSQPNDEGGFSRVTVTFHELITSEEIGFEDTGRDNWRIDGAGGEDEKAGG